MSVRVPAAEPPTPERLALAPHLELPPEPASVAKARAFLAEHVPDEGDVKDAAVLLTSELATNVVLHARTPMDVAVLADDDTIVLAVTDGSDTLPPGADTVAGPVAPGPPAEGGRGLRLVDLLATDWGVIARTSGKTIWCLLTRSRGARRPAAH